MDVNKNESLIDIEKRAVAEDHLRNTTVQSIAWRDITVTVKDRETKQPKAIVENVSGIVHAGEMLALMGPSGCGKTTLLNILASRPTNAATTTSTVLINGTKPSKSAFRSISCFVEQEDALIGALTVRETLSFASRLASTSRLPFREREARIDALLDSFGLHEQADTLIGTPIRKGISGGQKRRVGVASQLITSPKILFLDEPTSGLDSAASFEVMSYLKGVAKRNNLIVIASIHQPSTSTFNLFDKLLLLSGGRTHFFGGVGDVGGYYAGIGYGMPVHVNPAEFLLELVNVDFSRDRVEAGDRLEEMQRAWVSSDRAKELDGVVAETERRGVGGSVVVEMAEKKPSVPSLVVTLLHRSFVKSYRDVVAYGIRVAMYFGKSPPALCCVEDAGSHL